MTADPGPNDRLNGTQPGRPPIVVLAAGAGSRMHPGDESSTVKRANSGGGPAHRSPKLGMVVAGRPLLSWTLELMAAQSHGHSIWVMLAPGTPLVPICVVHGAACLVVDTAHRGMAWTIRAAIDEVLNNHRGIVMLLGDDPLAALALGDLLGAARDHPNSPVTVDREPPVPHPVYLPASLLRNFTPAAGGDDSDRGLRDLLAERDDVIRITTEAPAPIDADTPEQLARLGEHLRQLGHT